MDHANSNQIKLFSEWVLKIGDGRVYESNDEEGEIEIPDDILLHSTTNSI